MNDTIGKLYKYSERVSKFHFDTKIGDCCSAILKCSQTYLALLVTFFLDSVYDKCFGFNSELVVSSSYE